jgi:arabinofuranosyltransferase
MRISNINHVRLAVIVCALAVLLAHAGYYLPFISDDALISLQYSDRLLDGKGITWTEGQRVEGYSNLLWVLLTAFLGLIRIDLIFAARLLGVVSIGMIIVSIVYLNTREKRPRNILSLTAALLFLTLAGPVAAWSIGGLEQPLVAGLLAAAIALVIPLFEGGQIQPRRLKLVSLCLGLICITRPDGPIYTITMLLSLMIVRGINRATIRTAAKLAMYPAILYGGQLVFRLLYYGAWVPNSALIKIIPSSHHFSNGLTYTLGSLDALSPFSYAALLLLAVLLFSREKRPAAVLLSITTTAWLAYMVFIGGDYCPGWRHVLPVIALFAIAMEEGLFYLWEKFRKRSARAAVVVLLIIMVPGFVYNQFTDEQNAMAKKEKWEWHGRVIGLMLRQAFGEQQPLFAMTAAGCLPYFSKLPSLDMLGLNDYFIPRHPPMIKGERYAGGGPLGHELGHGLYVLDRKPDLICFCSPRGSEKACYLSGRQMELYEDFFLNYTLVRFQGRDPYEFTSLIYVRKFSEKIGISQSPYMVEIPAFLLNQNPDTFAFLNDKKELVVTVSRERYAAVYLPKVPAGHLNLQIKTPSPELLIPDIQRNEDGSVMVVILTNSLEEIEIGGVILVSSLAP